MNKANFSRSRVWFFLLGVLSVVLVVLLVLTALGKAPKRIEKGKDPDKTAEATDAPQEGLKTNAYPKVNALIEKYYSALTHNNSEVLKEIVKPFGDADQATVSRKSTFVESYENINCYSEDGADANTYIVFATYDTKFPNVDTMAPGLETLIVCTDENGNLYINNDRSTISEAMSAQLNDLLSREDVIKLVEDVQNSFAQIVQSDENVKSLCEQMGMDVSKIVAQATDAPAATQDPSVTPAPIGQVNKEMMAAQDLEIYSGPQEGDTVGTIKAGSLVYVTENVEGGFSSVQTDGASGYAKTAGIANYTLVDKEISATANYYASCSPSSAVLGTITSDQTYYCTLSLDNGWSQLLVNGTKVYVKTAEIGLDGQAAAE